MVVAHQGDDAAVLRRPGEVGVAEHVAGAVDARPLAVPDAEHAIELALATQFGLLRSPQCGRGQFLVETRLEGDIGRGQLLRRAHELLVEAAERRAAIAGDEAAGMKPGAAVALVLHQAEADDRLITGDEDPLPAQVVFVGETDRAQSRHRCLSSARSRHATQGKPTTGLRPI